jgi:propionate CoA-transferase
LDIAFLGAAQVSASGDVNVSRMSPDRLTGPGGFVDITQATKKVYFLCPFTAKGLDIDIPGNGTLAIKTEGEVKKFVPEVYEKTFSGNEAARRGQQVYYITERAVFRRTAAHPVIELVEIAPGVDLQRDVLAQMDFEPVTSPELKLMDKRIFMDRKMNVVSELFGSFEERVTYHENSHMVYLDLFGIILSTEEDVNWFFSSLRRMFDPILDQGKGPFGKCYHSMVIICSHVVLASNTVVSIIISVKKTLSSTTTEWTFGKALRKCTLPAP